MDERDEGVRSLQTCRGCCRSRKREGGNGGGLGLCQREEDLRKPIIMHQSISFILADMATKIEAARLLTLSAASALDSGERATLKAAHAKRFAADMCMEVTTDAVQVLGGYGYSEEYPVARRMRGPRSTRYSREQARFRG